MHFTTEPSGDSCNRQLLISWRGSHVWILTIYLTYVDCFPVVSELVQVLTAGLKGLNASHDYSQMYHSHYLATQSKLWFPILSCSVQLNFNRMNTSSEYGFKNPYATTIIYSTLSDSGETASYDF